MPWSNVDFCQWGFCYCLCSFRKPHLKHNYISYEKSANIFNLMCGLALGEGRMHPGMLAPTQCDPRVVDVAKGEDHRPTALGASAPPLMGQKRNKENPPKPITSKQTKHQKETDRSVCWSPVILGSPLALSEALSFLKYFNSLPCVPSSSSSSPFSSCF